MRTLFTYVGFAIASALLVSMALMPAGPVRSAPQRPMALTASAEPPTPTLVVETATPPERPTLPPTETPTTSATERPTLAPTLPPTSPPADDSGGDPGIADPYITKRANLDSVQVGDFVEFTLTVGNIGSAAATGVVVTDPVPGFLTIYNATTTRGLISVSGNTVTIEIGTVEPGEIITIVIRTRVNQQVAPPDNMNTATLSSSNGDEDLSNNASTSALSTLAAPTATPTTISPSPTLPAAPTQALPSATPAPVVTTPAVPPVPTAVSPAPVVPPAPTAASPAVSLPPTGADAAGWERIILPLLLIALGAALVGAAARRRSLR